MVWYIIIIKKKKKHNHKENMLFFFSPRGPSVNRAWGYCHGGTVKIEKCAGSKQTLTQTIREILSSGLKQPIQNSAVMMQLLSQQRSLRFGTEHACTYVDMIIHRFPWWHSDNAAFDVCIRQMLSWKVWDFVFPFIIKYTIENKRHGHISSMIKRRGQVSTTAFLSLTFNGCNICLGRCDVLVCDYRKQGLE